MLKMVGINAVVVLMVFVLDILDELRVVNVMGVTESSMVFTLPRLFYQASYVVVVFL